jgi:imidazoleglycerol phosphate synthase glutamine amidotransferase subunit HisH
MAVESHLHQTFAQRFYGQQITVAACRKQWTGAQFHLPGAPEKQGKLLFL